MRHLLRAIARHGRYKMVFESSNIQYEGKLNPNAKARLVKLGKEEQPLLIIDDLIEGAEQFYEMATNANWHLPDGTYYPGLNAPLPNEYIECLLTGLKPSLSRAFNFNHDARYAVNGFFALTTHEYEDFGPWQKIPHFDQTSAKQIALVHYLSPSQTGGTAFFRHNPTGFESISDARRAEYIDYVTKWIAANPNLLTEYTGPNTPDYEMLFKVPYKFNRAVLYPSNILHCALYDGTNQSADPKIGRITANSFWLPID